MFLIPARTLRRVRTEFGGLEILSTNPPSLLHIIPQSDSQAIEPDTRVQQQRERDLNSSASPECLRVDHRHIAQMSSASQGHRGCGRRCGRSAFLGPCKEVACRSRNVDVAHQPRQSSSVNCTHTDSTETQGPYGIGEERTRVCRIGGRWVGEPSGVVGCGVGIPLTILHQCQREFMLQPSLQFEVR